MSTRVLLLIFFGVLVPCLVGVAATSRYEGGKVVQLQAQLDSENGRSLTLATMREVAKENRRVREKFQMRVDVIVELRQHGISAAQTLETLGQAAHRAAAVNLTSAELHGQHLKIHALAKDATAISSFKTSLENAASYSCAPPASVASPGVADFDLDCTAKPTKRAR